MKTWHLTEFISESTPHTPTGYSKRIVSKGGTGFIVATGNHTICEGQNPNDGRLIAAAPELLAALKACLAFWNQAPSGAGGNIKRAQDLAIIKNNAQAAIAKAESND